MATVIASVFVIRAVAVWIGEFGAKREVAAQIWRTLSGFECSVDGLERVQTGGLNLKNLYLIIQPLQLSKSERKCSLLLLHGCQRKEVLKRFLLTSSAHLDMVQHQLFLPKVQGTVRAFEHRDFVIDDMLVEVRAQQGLQREHSVTHGALVDHPGNGKNSHISTKSWRQTYDEWCTAFCTVLQLRIWTCWTPALSSSDNTANWECVRQRLSCEN